MRISDSEGHERELDRIREMWKMCIYTNKDSAESAGAVNFMPERKRVTRGTFCCNPTFRSVLLLLCLAVAPGVLAAQSDSSTTQETTSQTNSSGQKQAPPPEAGGPLGDSGPYAIPKSVPDKNAKPAPPPSPKPTEGMPSYSINVDVPLVSVDALVLSKDGQFIPGLQKEHFRILEDNVVQPIQSFGVTKGGFTAVLLVEFASTPPLQRVSRAQFMLDALRASYAFTDQMEKNDYVAVISYDMKPTMVVDFTSSKDAVYNGLSTLRMPGFSETCLFDALYDTLDRVDRIAGRKEIILISSGVDTFSRITYDKVLKKIKATPNVTIYAISTGFLWRNYMEMRPGAGQAMRNMDYLQADNQMNTFAKMTGGRWYSPRFQGELPEDFRQIASAVRNQYSLTYRPTNAKLDGTYRKLKVEVVQPGTDKPLIVKDQKGKEVKIQVLSREGYTARHEVD